MNGAPRIAVLTVTYNAVAFLENFFASFMSVDTSGMEVELVVIDNGSTDGSPEWVRAEYPQVRVLENDENNYTKALNLGIAATDSDYVVITNNDAYVHEGWLTGLLDVFQADERIGAVREGVLRNHMIRADGSYRDSVYYSVTDTEWPTVKAHLEQLLVQTR